jgi:hypothetical protein
MVTTAARAFRLEQGMKQAKKRNIQTHNNSFLVFCRCIFPLCETFSFRWCVLETNKQNLLKKMFFENIFGSKAVFIFLLLKDPLLCAPRFVEVCLCRDAFPVILQKSGFVKAI